jgi:hypothetical protein
LNSDSTEDLAKPKLILGLAKGLASDSSYKGSAEASSSGSSGPSGSASAEASSSASPQPSGSASAKASGLLTNSEIDAFGQEFKSLRDKLLQGDLSKSELMRYQYIQGEFNKHRRELVGTPGFSAENVYHDPLSAITAEGFPSTSTYSSSSSSSSSSSGLGNYSPEAFEKQFQEAKAYRELEGSPAQETASTQDIKGKGRAKD